ncbi:hypothetical protein ACWCXX_28000 [Streptomyces sp. NPDC001732]
MRSDPARASARRTPRRAPTPGQVGSILTMLAAIGVLSRFFEGPGFWLGALLGTAGVLGAVVAFSTACGWIQMSLGTIAVLTGAMFVMHALTLLLV